MIKKENIKKSNKNQHNTKNNPIDQQNSAKIKQDINFLDKPLWFQNATPENRVWTDIDGYEYRTGYKVPEKIDMIILLYLLIKTQELNYQKKLSLSRYEILKGCDLLQSHPTYYYNRLEDSLKRWKNVSIEFQGTFYDGNKYVSMGFGIIDDYKINTDIKRVEINFNENWLLKVKESTFFKYLNFEYYKALKRPLSRRLFEILCKTFKERNIWSIHLNKLGAKLTLQGRKRKNRNCPYENIYASDVLVAIKPAINELNHLAIIPDIAKKLNINDLFTLQYKITGDKQDRIIHFTKVPIPLSTTDILIPNEILTLIPLEHREKITLKKLIVAYLNELGVDYVKRNIEYTNKHSKKNYRAYLDKALQEDWGLGFQEDMIQKENFNNIELHEGMMVDWNGKVFNIEKGICIKCDGGYLPHGMILQFIKEGRMKIISLRP